MSFENNMEYLEWFKYDHLPMHLQTVSKPFCELAVACWTAMHLVQDSAAMTQVLQNLLIAKDAAVRAAMLQQKATDKQQLSSTVTNTKKAERIVKQRKEQSSVSPNKAFAVILENMRAARGGNTPPE